MRMKLSDMTLGKEGVVRSIEDSLKNKVAGMGIRVGKRIKMPTKQPMGGPVVVTVDGSTISLGRGVAEKIVVEVEE